MMKLACMTGKWCVVRSVVIIKKIVKSTITRFCQEVCWVDC